MPASVVVVPVVVILTAGEIAAQIVGVLVRGLLLPLGEVAAPLVVHAVVPGLLALGEVAAVLLLGGLGLRLLAGRESTVRIIVRWRVVVVGLILVLVYVILIGIVVVVVPHRRSSVIGPTCTLCVGRQRFAGRVSEWSPAW